MAAILLVEDSLLVAATLTRSLRSCGYKVSHADTIGGALSILRRRSISLVLLDLCLPDGDGVALLEHLHRDEDQSLIPVIVVTAFTDYRTIDYLKSLGARHCLTKGAYSTEELLRMMGRYVTPTAPITLRRALAGMAS